ncbi:ABC transporter type 1, transmembrane domain, partial [Dillenia turbinata]
VGIKVYGSKAYVPQNPWIQPGTVRECAFWLEMNKDLYEAVLEACALNRDIRMWKDGDLSLIGERALNLSGGQKQRVQLSRAIYIDADVYFWDDPFSAVDAHTGAHMSQKCLKGLLAKKTVIYVNHQLEFLDAADLVLSELVKQEEACTKSLNQVSTPQQDGLSSSIGTLQMVQNEVMKTSLKDTNAYEGALVPIVLLGHILFQGVQIGSNYWLAWGTEEEGRSSTDQRVVDTDIPYRVAGLAFALVQLFSIIILTSLVAWPIFLSLPCDPHTSMWYQDYYINTARELARMEGTRKALLVHHFSESIAGATTICCFNQEMWFSMKCLNLVDDFSRVAFHNSATMEWLCVRINFLFNFVFFIVLVILVTMPSSAIGPSLAGLIATYGLNLNVLQARVIGNMCNVENKMVSVERTLQFTDIPSQAPLLIKDSRPAPMWPEHGCIELKNLHVRYKPSLPMVLKGITCTFPGEKKGSGNSTIIQSLFRVVEPAQGRIIIDGVDISTIGLEDLRPRLSIIPQDPTLFQGTMRANVDPPQQHSDQEIWEV